MDIDEYKNSDDYPNGLFINENMPRTFVRYNENEKEAYLEVYSKNGEKRQYDVYNYFRLFHMYIGAIKATDEPKHTEQIKILLEARSFIIHLSENMKRLTQGVELKSKYKYSGFVKSMDALIKMSEADLQTKLLDSQVEANNSTIATNANIVETNKNINSTNTVLKRIFLWTAIIAAVGVIVAGINTYLESQKYQSKQQLQLKDSMSQAKQVEISQLKAALDSCHRKP